jgi:hypothetical protein
MQVYMNICMHVHYLMMKQNYNNLKIKIINPCLKKTKNLKNVSFVT